MAVTHAGWGEGSMVLKRIRALFIDVCAWSSCSGLADVTISWRRVAGESRVCVCVCLHVCLCVC